MPGRVPMEIARTAAIGAAMGRFGKVGTEDLTAPAYDVRSMRLTAIGTELIYECLVHVAFERRAVYGWLGNVKVPAEPIDVRLQIQVDAATGEVVGMTELA